MIEKLKENIKKLNVKIYIGIAVLVVLAIWFGMSFVARNKLNMVDSENGSSTDAGSSSNVSRLGCAAGNMFDTVTGKRCAVSNSAGTSSLPQLNPLTPKSFDVAKAYSAISSDWVWVKTTYAVSGWASAHPAKAGDFVLTMNADKTISVKGDCNSTSGTYTVSENTISAAETPDEAVIGKLAIVPGATTEKYCQRSVEKPFLKDLSKVSSYDLRMDSLDLILSNNQGIMKFSRKVSVQS